MILSHFQEPLWREMVVHPVEGTEAGGGRAAPQGRHCQSSGTRSPGLIRALPQLAFNFYHLLSVQVSHFEGLEALDFSEVVRWGLQFSFSLFLWQC